MAQQSPLHFVFYIAAPPNQVRDGFVSPESNRVLFMGAELEVDLKPGGPMNWVGTGADGKRITYVRGEVLQSEPPHPAAIHLCPRLIEQGLPRYHRTHAGKRGHQGFSDASPVG